MPTDCRELALQAFLARLETVEGYTVLRNLDRELRTSEYPALIMTDGGEDEDEDLRSTGLLALRMRVSVDVVVKVAQGVNVGPALNDGRAKVRVAIASDPQLGETAIDVQYGGADDPDIADELSGDIGRAVLPLGFTIVRQEAELDPYSFF